MAGGRKGNDPGRDPQDDDETDPEDEIYVDDLGNLVDSSGAPIDPDNFVVPDDYEDDGDETDPEDEPPMRHRQSIELVLEMAPIGAELVFCRNTDPKACTANNYRAEREDIEPCPSCAVIEMTEDLTVDQVIQIVSLN